MGDTFVIPASLGEYTVKGKSKVLNYYTEDNTEKYNFSNLFYTKS